MQENEKKSKNSRLKKKLKEKPKAPNEKLLGPKQTPFRETGSRIKKRGQKLKDLSKELGI